MGFLVTISLPAQADLVSIGRYIARDNPPRARSFTDELVRKTDVLADSPELGRAVPDFHDPAVREVIHRSYRILYEVSRAARTVSILRFWHGSRGTPRLTDDE